MSLRDVFTPLLHALTGGRAPSSSAPPFDLDPFWQPLLRALRLPENALHEVVLRESLAPHFHYRRSTKLKKDGTQREIMEPDFKLKHVQHAVLQRYLAAEMPHPSAVAYRRGMSIADHVWPHVGAEVIITADVRDFFPSTATWRVEAWWRQRVEEADARLLTLLTTDRGGLPQGAPTSPALSNLVNLEMDTRLSQLAGLSGARFTRYCDDMVFSWDRYATPPSDFQCGCQAILAEHEYQLHPSKGWQVHPRCDEPEITGVILTKHGKVRLPEKLQRMIRELRRSDDPRDVQRLAGYRGYERMISKRPVRRPKRGKSPRRHRPDSGDNIPF